ncbi:uncharacterized protein METZ01_LOCUS460665, partial [marine metagenome]
RTFFISMLGLYMNSLHIGLKQGNLDNNIFLLLLDEMKCLADIFQTTIDTSDALAMQIAEEYVESNEFVFCGSGPNYASALFCSAKILEACGDNAIGQDIEEWAHSYYFARKSDTPTFIITAGGRDSSRVKEVATAAKRIGRRVVGIAPKSKEYLVPNANYYFPVNDSVKELFWPLLGTIAGALFAAHRARLIKEDIFRGFKGGREISENGGICRIYNSDQWKNLQ